MQIFAPRFIENSGGEERIGRPGVVTLSVYINVRILKSGEHGV
jgi:hypothetical protein